LDRSTNQIIAITDLKQREKPILATTIEDVKQQATATKLRQVVTGPATALSKSRSLGFKQVFYNGFKLF